MVASPVWIMQRTVPKCEFQPPSWDEHWKLWKSLQFCLQTHGIRTSVPRNLSSRGRAKHPPQEEKSTSHPDRWWHTHAIWCRASHITLRFHGFFQLNLTNPLRNLWASMRSVSAPRAGPPNHQVGTEGALMSLERFRSNAATRITRSLSVPL